LVLVVALIGADHRSARDVAIPIGAMSVEGRAANIEAGNNNSE
jgi:hypothetical protein